MKKLEFKELLKLVKFFYNKKIKWHYHLLTPDCKFNKNSKKYAIILENSKSSEKFVSFFNRKPRKEVKELDKLFYGRK